MASRSEGEVSAIVAQLRTIEQHVEHLQEAGDAPSRRLALGVLENAVEELLITLRTILDGSSLVSATREKNPTPNQTQGNHLRR